MSYWVRDNWAPEELVLAANEFWPDKSWDQWHYYNGKDSIKYASRSCSDAPLSCQELLCRMSCLDLKSMCSCDVQGLFADWSYYGAGLHMIPKGGRLIKHYDSDKHPLRNWQRRLNAILFIDEIWEKEWLGDLCFWNKDEIVERISPKFNRLVVFESCNILHSVESPVGVDRKTLSVFYWKRSNEQSTRTSAEFV